MKIIALVLILLCSMPSWAKPLVVTTIRPLTMLVEAIAGDTVEIRQLLPDSEVPHHYSLRISERALISQADLVLWVGPELESFLSKTVTSLPPEKVITAAALPDIRWPHAENAKPQALKDPHIWMDPSNGLTIATEVSNWLAAHHPTQSGALLASQKPLGEQLSSTLKATKVRLDAVKHQHFLVDHDAFNHFSNAFDLHQDGALKTGAGLSSSAREHHRLLNQTGIHCLIAEPQHNPARTAKVATKLGAQIAIIDPLGVDIPLDKNAYANFISDTGNKIADCLASSKLSQ